MIISYRSNFMPEFNYLQCKINKINQNTVSQQKTRHIWQKTRNLAKNTAKHGKTRHSSVSAESKGARKLTADS